MKRLNETSRLTPGQKVKMDEFPGTIVRLYIDGPYEGARMYEVRLPGGLSCVCGSDLIPVKPLTRDQKLKAVWKHTHKDYKGTMNGTKTIMVYRNGTCLIDLGSLTDQEINERLPKELRETS